MSGTKRVPVAVVDPLEAMRRGLAEIIHEKDIYEVVVLVGSVDELLQACEARPALIVIMDHAAPVAECNLNIIRIRTHFPAIRVLAWGSDTRRVVLWGALQAGARGFLPKKACAGKVHVALDAVRVNGCYQDDELTRAALDDEAQGAQTPADLNEPELRCLLYLASHPDATPAQVAHALGMATNTVLNHLKHMHSKFEVHTRTAMMVKAQQQGFW